VIKIESVKFYSTSAHQARGLCFHEGFDNYSRSPLTLDLYNFLLPLSLERQFGLRFALVYALRGRAKFMEFLVSPKMFLGKVFGVSCYSCSNALSSGTLGNTQFNTWADVYCFVKRQVSQ
jgi:hypothetical protein